MMKLLVFGAGFSGSAIGRRCAADGAQVWGTTRSSERQMKLEEMGVAPLFFDGVAMNSCIDVLSEITHLIVSIAPPRQGDANKPDEITDPVLKAMAHKDFHTQCPNLKWIGYLSTVGVYGNHDGKWVDEETPIAPTSERSRQRVRAEAEWLSVGEATGIPVGVFRLSGIYGPGRNAFVTIEKGKSRRLVKEGQVFNRIHAEDIAVALQLAASQKVNGIFNITDNMPAPPQDVVTFAHELMGREPPPEIDFETADITPMARSFYGENKRVFNAKSKLVLGLEYEWPTIKLHLHECGAKEVGEDKQT